MYFQFTSIEPLQLSPFIYQEMCERETGLAQLQNISVIMNMQDPVSARLIRNTVAYGAYCGAFAYDGGNPFSKQNITGQFLTPAAELMPIPEINVVDYQQVVAYQYPATVQNNLFAESQTLSLPIIPDYLVVALVPAPSYYTPVGAVVGVPSGKLALTEGTWYVPIKQVNVTWSNMSGLLSSLVQSQLFNISRENGLKLSWAEFRGYAFSTQPQLNVTPQFSLPGNNSQWCWPGHTPSFPGVVQTCGGPLVLRPGKDITLETGQASGMSAGQWTANFKCLPDLTALSPEAVTAFSVQGKCNLTVLAVNGGFFATKNGSSRVIIGPVPAGTVVKASTDMSAQPVATGKRLIGAGKHSREGHLMAGRVM